jgi:hypothetical protein
VIIESPATHVYEFRLILYTGLAEDESGHTILTAGVVAVAALVVLAGCLPGHAKPVGDLGPPDTQADGVVDQHRELRLCLLLRNRGAPARRRAAERLPAR